MKCSFGLFFIESIMYFTMLDLLQCMFLMVQKIFTHQYYSQLSFMYFHIDVLIKILTKAATRGDLYKKMLLKISQYSKENACVEVYF